MSITLISKEKKSFEIETALCKQSKYLQDRIDLGETEIKLKDIPERAIELIINYMREYKDKEPSKVPTVFASADLFEELSPFDAKFISEVSFETAIHLINAALFLNLEHLHDVACAKLSVFLKGKTPQEINEQFTFSLEVSKEEALEIGINFDE